MAVSRGNLGHGDDQGPGGTPQRDDAGQERGGIRTVLVATDFSAHADAAVSRAFELATRHGAEVTVLHVAPSGAGPELAAVAERSLWQLVADAPVPAVTVCAAGSPAVEITREAERRGAEVVVIGAHGAHWLRDLFIGATANAVVDASRVPVLLTRSSENRPYSRALLAVEASARAFEAARAGLTLIPNAEHVLAHAVTVLGENLLRLNGVGDEEIEQLRRAQLSEVRDDVERLADELTPRPAEILVEPGRPEELVPELAARHGAELVAVGVDRRTRLRHALMGSVSRHVMLRASCDVLVVPLL